MGQFRCAQRVRDGVAEPLRIWSHDVSAMKSSMSNPKWDRDRHELRVGDRIVKRFKRPAVNQETILATFEDDGWPSRIDDPLPTLAEQDPKQRLHDTIKCLNRSQKRHLIHFQGRRHWGRCSLGIHRRRPKRSGVTRAIDRSRDHNDPCGCAQ